MTHTLPTVPTYKPTTCRRCKGTGQHSNYGGYTGCFNCKGTGSDLTESGSRPMNSEEHGKWISYLMGEAYVMDRARDRAIRKAR